MISGNPQNGRNNESKERLRQALDVAVVNGRAYPKGQKDEVKERKLLFYTQWDDIKDFIIERDKIGYDGLSDFPRVLKYLPMKEYERPHNVFYRVYGLEDIDKVDSSLRPFYQKIVIDEMFRKMGVESNEEKKELRSLLAKLKLQEEVFGPLVRTCTEAIWSWIDADLLCEEHPNATAKQNEAIKKTKESFVNDILYAERNNDAKLRAFIAQVEKYTKENIEEAIKYGIDLKYFNNDTDKLHYFRTIPEKDRLFDTFVKIFRGAKKDIDINSSTLSKETGIDKEVIEGIIQRKIKPTRGQMRKLEAAIMPEYNGYGLIPTKASDDWVINFKRDYDDKKEHVRGGKPQLEYTELTVHVTNFPPLVRAARQKLIQTFERPEIPDAWKSDFGEKPKFNPQILVTSKITEENKEQPKEQKKIILTDATKITS